MTIKPTGQISSIRVSVSSGGSVVSKETPINFATNKEDIEKQIVTLFERTTKTAGFKFVSPPQQNKQDDFDFTLTLPGRKVYMELTEFVTRNKDVPYHSHKTIRKCGELHDEFMETIKKKSIKTNTRLRGLLQDNILPVHLLCYTTHSDYNIDDVVISLLQQTLTRFRHSFEHIFILQPISEDFANVRLLFPFLGPKLDKEILVQLRENLLVNVL